MCKTLQFDEFSAQVDAVRSALSSRQSAVEAHEIVLMGDGAAAQRAFLEDAVAKLRRRVVDPFLAMVS